MNADIYASEYDFFHQLPNITSVASTHRNRGSTCIWLGSPVSLLSKSEKVRSKGAMNDRNSM